MTTAAENVPTASELWTAYRQHLPADVHRLAQELQKHLGTAVHQIDCKQITTYQVTVEHAPVKSNAKAAALVKQFERDYRIRFVETPPKFEDNETAKPTTSNTVATPSTSLPDVKISESETPKPTTSNAVATPSTSLPDVKISESETPKPTTYNAVATPSTSLPDVKISESSASTGTLPWDVAYTLLLAAPTQAVVSSDSSHDDNESRGCAIVATLCPKPPRNVDYRFIAKVNGGCLEQSVKGDTLLIFDQFEHWNHMLTAKKADFYLELQQLGYATRVLFLGSWKR